MSRLRPGWLIAASAAALAGVVWLPWLTTTVGGGGRANAVGGTVGNLTLTDGFGVGQLIMLLTSALLVAGAMAARGLWMQWAAAGALVVSLVLAGLVYAYWHLNVVGAVLAGYGWYVAAAIVAAAVGFSVWAVVVAARTPQHMRVWASTRH